MGTVMEDTMQNNSDHKESIVDIDFEQSQILLDVLDGFIKKGWLYLAVISIVGTLCFFAAKFLYSPYYEAYTTFTVNSVSTVNYNSRSQKNNATYRMGKVFPYILTSDALRSLVANDMGYNSAEEMPVEILASVVTDTNLVTLKVRSDDPQTSYDTLRSVIRNYPSISEVAIGEVTLKQMDESGLPAEPANKPISKRAAALGMILCILIITSALLVKSVTRKTIRTESELTRYFNIQYLGNMPSVVFKKRSRIKEPTVTIDSEGIPFAFVESIRTIRHRVEREAQKYNAKVILVTSALQSEGKTTLSTNLAIALANRKHNVLLVDDSPIVLEGGLPILRQALPGANIVGFTRRQEAVEYFTQNPVSLAFLDIELGRSSGLDLCRELLRIRPRTNVIYLTGYREYAFDAWDTGACGFLLKPLDAEEILRQIPKLRYPVRGLI